MSITSPDKGWQPELKRQKESLPHTPDTAKEWNPDPNIVRQAKL